MDLEKLLATHDPAVEEADSVGFMLCAGSLDETMSETRSGARSRTSVGTRTVGTEKPKRVP